MFVALGEGDHHRWTLWGYFMRHPVAFVRKEPCLPFTLNGSSCGKLVFVCPPQKASVQFCLCVRCVCLRHGCLSPSAVHSGSQGRFMNWPGSACFYAKGRIRSKFLFNNSKMIFFSDSSSQQASYKEDIYLLFEALAVQLCCFGVMIRS